MAEIRKPTATAKRMWALPAAEFAVDNAMMVNGGESKQITIPSPAFLIEHPQGLVLFDTGLSPHAIADPAAYYGPLFSAIQMDFGPEKAIDRVIAGLGYKPGRIAHVIMSHMHFDHSGAMYLFPQAKFHAFEGDLRYAYWPDPQFRWVFKFEDLTPTRDFDWNELTDDFDLFGDGSIVFFKTAGHTPGEGSLLVRLPHRSIILTGDTVHVREALEREAGMAMDVDPLEAVRGIQRLKRLRDQYKAEVWINHDPEDWAGHPKAPTAID